MGFPLEAVAVTAAIERKGTQLQELPQSARAENVAVGKSIYVDILADTIAQLSEVTTIINAIRDIEKKPFAMITISGIRTDYRPGDRFTLNRKDDLISIDLIVRDITWDFRQKNTIIKGDDTIGVFHRMKIIQDDRTTSINASTPFSSTNYPISNVQDDKVSSRYIADTSGGTNSATITVNLTGTSSAPVEGFFVAGLMADSGTWSFQNANGSTVHESGTLTTTDIASSDIAGNTNTLNNYFDGQDNPLLSKFIAFSNPQTTTCRLVLTLSTSTNRKGQNIKEILLHPGTEQVQQQVDLKTVVMR